MLLIFVILHHITIQEFSFLDISLTCFLKMINLLRRQIQRECQNNKIKTLLYQENISMKSIPP